MWSSQVINLWIPKPIRPISNSHRLRETINTFKDNYVLVQWPWSIYDSDPSLACPCLSHISILNACGYGAVAAHWLTIHIELLCYWGFSTAGSLQVLKVSMFLEFLRFFKVLKKSLKCSWHIEVPWFTRSLTFLNRSTFRNWLFIKKSISEP